MYAKYAASYPDLSLTVQIRAQRNVGRRKKAVFHVPIVPRAHSNAKGLWRRQLHMGTFEAHFLFVWGERTGRGREGRGKIVVIKY